MDYEALSGHLTELFSHSLKWFEHEALYIQCHFGTKALVEELLHSVETALCLLRDADESAFSVARKRQVFSRLQHEFGQSCLCLSGGATMTFYQFGVIRTLLDHGLLPHIISGTSGGSLVGSVVAVRTDKELRHVLNAELHHKLNAADEPLMVRLERLLRTGSMFKWEDWRRKLRELTFGDTTFAEAYRRTGRILYVVNCEL